MRATGKPVDVQNLQNRQESEMGFIELELRVERAGEGQGGQATGRAFGSLFA